MQKNISLPKIINSLKNGKIGVMPTDTIYGIVGSALNPPTVEEIYQLRKRAKDKPMIILISSLDDLKKFEVRLTKKQKEFLQKNWPNPLSVVLPCSSEKFKYLHRGTFSLAFRMPKDEKFLGLLHKTGPLVAPSANFEGEKPSQTIEQAKHHFGEALFYVDGGRKQAKSSTIIQLNSEATTTVLRGSEGGWSTVSKTS